MNMIIRALLSIIACFLFIAAFILLLYAGMHVFNSSPVCLINLPVAIFFLVVAWRIYGKLDRHE